MAHAATLEAAPESCQAHVERTGGVREAWGPWFVPVFSRSTSSFMYRTPFFVHIRQIREESLDTCFLC